MQTSDKGLEFTMSSEGVRLKAYQDTGGVWTNGLGHTGPDVFEGQVITKEQALAWFRNDIKGAERAVDRLVKVALTQGQFDACVDMVFNVGEGAFSKSTFLRLLNAGNYTAASEEFKRWVYDNGKVQPGLVKRAAGRKEMFLSK